MINSNFKFAAIIPFFNEAYYINKVVLLTVNYVDYVICVDDGSTDNYELNFPANDKVILVKHDKNCGKGKAINTGIEIAKKIKVNFVVTLDGDMQHDPKLIPKFINLIDEYDLIIGKRDFKARQMPISRKISNFLSSKIISLVTKQKILDSQSGYRLINIKLFDNIAIESFSFEAETEIILKAAELGYKIGMVPISTIYSDNDNSKIKNFNSIIGFIKVIIKFLYEKNKKKFYNKRT